MAATVYAAAATSSMAATASAFIPPANRTIRCSSSSSSSSLPYLPPRSTSFSSSIKQFSVSRRLALKIKATDETSSSVDTSEIFTDLKAKWDAVENKSTVIVYGGGAVVAVWLSSILVGAINSVPLLPKVMELVGLGYTGWFVYRYLLFKSSRKELATDIEALKKKIAGTTE
ncbi:protein CURVATURE THYLAKOID 1A, chloroplastic [Euphorbia lathyris]|uniref:protein CURVATURE THYLAKOID 1A, chloroplastic n=1 Tax=Euphorbia lathyris TaxID=212925 RepID=UPI003313663F